MDVSIFDIFTVGIGPSSSHTVGPMRAAYRFMEKIIALNQFENIAKIKCDFYGSLALTGKGHGTDKAFLLGIQGFTPENIDSDSIEQIINDVKKNSELVLKFNDLYKKVQFKVRGDLKFHRRVSLPYHPNGMAFEAFDNNNNSLFQAVYYSVGGGFIVKEGEEILPKTNKPFPYSFNSARELMAHTKELGCNISDLILKNEMTLRTENEIKNSLNFLWSIMDLCISRGLKNEGILPGGLQVKRRAPALYKALGQKPFFTPDDNLLALDWINLYALCVNEENAAGGQVVTAPTNGAAGILPAVLKYYLNFVPNASMDKVSNFFLTAGAIAILYKKNASISGAEVGCQGEVGVACSMAAGALCEILGGSVEQVENAAEIAMEHNLGLTCDPIGGLVQIPCIERNAMGAIKAINAARMALRGDGTHYVSLDKVIATMKQTGKDMKKSYKETSRGGLAVNIPEC